MNGLVIDELESMDCLLKALYRVGHMPSYLDIVYQCFCELAHKLNDRKWSNMNKRLEECEMNI